MNLVNATRMVAGYTLGRDASARESLVVAVKGTFKIPAKGQDAVLADEQVPLIEADTFSGEPGFTAPIYESDYPPFKPRCDVLLNGSAHAPGGKPVQHLMVAMRVGPITKSFNVVGDRKWAQGMVGFAPSEPPEFFTRLPVSYDNAFGGIDETDPDKPRYYAPNHAGVGFHHHLSLDSVVGQPLPNTEESANPVANPRGQYRPMAFGPIGRSWEPRPKYAGTYDQNWIDNVFPFLPDDFQNEYYQCAPHDQQMDYIKGGEEVTLVNLTPEGKTEFRLPAISIPVEITDLNYNRTELKAVCDTLILEPDHRRFLMIWRASHVLTRDILEILHVVVGTPTSAWRRARDTGKVYYRSLAALGE